MQAQVRQREFGGNWENLLLLFLLALQFGHPSVRSHPLFLSSSTVNVSVQSWWENLKGWMQHWVLHVLRRTGLHFHESKECEKSFIEKQPWKTYSVCDYSRDVWFFGGIVFSFAHTKGHLWVGEYTATTWATLLVIISINRFPGHCSYVGVKQTLKPGYILKILVRILFQLIKWGKQHMVWIAQQL